MLIPVNWADRVWQSLTCKYSMHSVSLVKFCNASAVQTRCVSQIQSLQKNINHTFSQLRCNEPSGRMPMCKFNLSNYDNHCFTLLNKWEVTRLIDAVRNGTRNLHSRLDQMEAAIVVLYKHAMYDSFAMNMIDESRLCTQLWSQGLATRQI